MVNIPAGIIHCHCRVHKAKRISEAGIMIPHRRTNLSLPVSAHRIRPPSKGLTGSILKRLSPREIRPLISAQQPGIYRSNNDHSNPATGPAKAHNASCREVKRVSHSIQRPVTSSRSCRIGIPQQCKAAICPASWTITAGISAENHPESSRKKSSG